MKELTLEITGKCTQECPWCSSSATPKGKHADYPLITSSLKNFREQCDVVRFSGGEPTLHPELPRFLSFAKSLGYQNILLTNGKHLTRLFRSIDHNIDEYWVNIVDDKSILEVLVLQGLGRKVIMEVVLVKGNEEWIRRALNTSMLYKVPVRLLVLQKQGRGANCEPLDLISWTGNKGCVKDNKITVTHDGRVVTCSALKYGQCPLSYLFGKE